MRCKYDEVRFIGYRIGPLVAQGFGIRLTLKFNIKPSSISYLGFLDVYSLKMAIPILPSTCSRTIERIY